MKDIDLEKRTINIDHQLQRTSKMEYVIEPTKTNAGTRVIPMTKPKTLDQLQAEKEQAETQLAQEQHKLERLENRKRYLEKGERTKRTHRICNLGGTIESLAPEVKDLTRTEMTELMEHLPFLWETRKALSG